MSQFIPQFEPQIRFKDTEAVKAQMLSGWVGPSKTTIAFEEKIQEITGAKHCIATTSGTTAIMLGIIGMKLPKGSTILFPAYTFLAGANACRLLGYKVQLVDIKADTLCMDPRLVLSALEADDKIDISCVMFVNHNAYVGEDVAVTKSICDKYNVPMLEDSSQAMGMPMAGRTGKVGIFSFSVPKLITTGQGGAVITDDDDVADGCLRWRDHGDVDWRKTKIHHGIGGNFKFNDILASYGLSQLNDLEELLLDRKALFNKYRSRLKVIDYGYDSTWMIVYRCVNVLASTIVHALSEQNIQGTRYYRPIHHNPPYHTDIAYDKSALAYRDIIYLPSSLNLRQQDVDRICSIVNEAEGII